MAEPKRQKTIWYVIGCIGLGLLTIPCVGILAAVAIPAFVNYGRRAKAAEAESNVRTISHGVIAYCEMEHFPPAPSVLPEAVGPSLAIPNATRQPQDFSAAGWQSIGFGPGEPLYYAYSIVRPDASTLQIVAEGDLDGDGERSHYQIDCTATPPSGCSCGEVIATNELE